MKELAQVLLGLQVQFSCRLVTKIRLHCPDVFRFRCIPNFGGDEL